MEEVRLNKYLADKGYSTRRGADVIIESGKVIVNGKVAKIGQKIKIGDKVEVKDNIKKEKYVYYAYNKPIGVETVNAQGEGKDILKTIKFPTKVFPIGRLDKDSRGLIIMTNDGRITDRLLSPDKTHEKEYIVKVDSDFNNTFLPKLEKGVKLGDYTTKPCKTKRINEKTFSIILTEGKKRQIRKMVALFRHFVIDLKRERIMNIKLGKTPEGSYREIKGEELTTFLNKIGL